MITRDISQPTLVADARASVHLEPLGASAPRVVGRGSCLLVAVTRDCSRPSIEMLDAGEYRLIVQDDAQPVCHDWPAKWRPRPSEVYVGQRLDSLSSPEAAERSARRFVDEGQRCGNRVAAMRAGNAIPMVCDNTVDVRWVGGTVHIELPGVTGDEAWLSPDAHDPHPFTEASRAACCKKSL